MQRLSGAPGAAAIVRGTRGLQRFARDVVASSSSCRIVVAVTSSSRRVVAASSSPRRRIPPRRGSGGNVRSVSLCRSRVVPARRRRRRRSRRLRRSSRCGVFACVPRLSSPPGPHHQCWSSRSRVIRPRLYPHRYPHRNPHRYPRPRPPPHHSTNVSTSASTQVSTSVSAKRYPLVVACHPSPPLSSPHPRGVSDCGSEAGAAATVSAWGCS